MIALGVVETQGEVGRSTDGPTLVALGVVEMVARLAMRICFFSS